MDESLTNSKQLQWISKHIIVSVSVASEPVCIVEVSPNLLVTKMMKQIQGISRNCWN